MAQAVNRWLPLAAPCTAMQAPVFGFIGRLEEQKGVDILLAALGKIPKSTNAQVLCGAGSSLCS